MSVAGYTITGAAIGCILGIIVGGWLFKSPRHLRLNSSTYVSLKHLKRTAKTKYRRYFRKLPYAYETADSNSPHIGSRFYL